MIRSTFGGFMTARLGMSAAQAGLNLTGHNLTNSATTGYTRQRIDQVSLNTGGNYRYASAYNVNIGNGVLVTGTSQLRDSFLDLRYRNEVANVGYENVKNNVLNDLADILDEVKNSKDDALSGGGIFNQLGDILEKLQQLSNQVGNKEFDNMVKTSCQQLTTLFNSYSARIDEVQDNLTDDLTNVDIPRVNEILKNISELNKTIKSSEIYGESALELKDQRNLLLDELAQYMKINVKYTPVQVSDSTTIEELSISMENYDPTKKDYVLVDGEQYRQLECKQDATTGDWNITLSAMQVDCNPPQETAVDPDAASALNNAISSLQSALEKYNPDTLAQTYIEAHNNFSDIINLYNTAQKTLTNATAEAETALTDWQTAKNTLSTERSTLTALKKKEGVTEDEIAAQQAKVDAAQKDLEEKAKARTEKDDAVRTAEKAVAKLESDYKEAQKAYNKAYENLPKDLENAPNWTLTKNADGKYGLDDTQTTNILNILKDANCNTKLPDGDPLIAGGGKSSEKLNELAKNLTTAQARYDQSVKDSAAITDDNGEALVVNDAFTDGKLRGTLEMLNCEGTYDGTDVRGIGYYKNMLDTLANTFANEMNKLNTDAFGNEKPLFTNKDGGTEGITASDIRIAEDWLNGEYGITATTQMDSANPGQTVEGANDNILRFIQLFSKDVLYTTGLDIPNTDETYFDANKNPVFLDKDGNVVKYDKIRTTTTWKGKDGTVLGTVTVEKDAEGKETETFTLDNTKYKVEDGKLLDAITGDAIEGATSEIKYTPISVKTAEDGTPAETELTYEHLRTTQQVFYGTFEEAFTNIGTVLGLDIKGTAENLSNYELLAGNLSDERDSVTGVSLDEEAMSIMQYSQSYNAAARLMTALDEMLETLITGTGKVGR